jgi:hypothetical protein
MVKKVIKPIDTNDQGLSLKTMNNTKPRVSENKAISKPVITKAVNTKANINAT